jgi:hypothetical protein
MARGKVSEIIPLLQNRFPAKYLLMVVVFVQIDLFNENTVPL